MRTYTIILSGLLCCFHWMLAFAQTSEEEPTGEVVIGAPEGSQIDEFRVNGQLYMIRVQPQKGPPYYLVDTDGDGQLESHKNELAPRLLIPTWVLKRW